jgi:hypothetical protein
MMSEHDRVAPWSKAKSRRRFTALFAGLLPAGFLVAVLWLLPAAVQAQIGNGITSPAPGDVLSGVVLVEGTAVHPDFLRYELAFLNQSQGSSDWIVFAQGDQPVISGTLAVWDTTVGLPTNPVFPDGFYQLRLRVVRTDYNYDEYYARDLAISNLSATPTPTATLATEVATLAPGTAVVGTPVLPVDTGVLPTLTPFPTSTPLPTVAGVNPEIEDETADPAAGETRGLLARVTAVDTSRFGRAFGLGARIALFTFVALAGYLALRASARWLWRAVQSRRYR